MYWNSNQIYIDSDIRHSIFEIPLEGRINIWIDWKLNIKSYQMIMLRWWLDIGESAIACDITFIIVSRPREVKLFVRWTSRRPGYHFWISAVRWCTWRLKGWEVKENVMWIRRICFSFSILLGNEKTSELFFPFIFSRQMRRATYNLYALTEECNLWLV